MELAAAASPTAVVSTAPFIRTAAEKCEAVFHESLLHPELQSLEDQLGRFRLWAANIEVFAKSRASLDYRLRYNEGTRDMVLQMLQVLHMTINFCIKTVTSTSAGSEKSAAARVIAGESDSSSSSSEPADDGGLFQPSTISDTVEEVKGLISRLQRVSCAIRKASKDNRNRRVAQFAITDPADMELQSELEAFSAFMLITKYPRITTDLRKLLIDTMLLRQKRLIYAARRHSHSAKRLMLPENDTSQTQRLNQAKHGPTLQAKDQPEPSQNPDEMAEVISLSADSRLPPKSQITATTFENRPLKYDSHRVTAQTVRSRLQDQKLAWPAPPKLMSSGLDRQCPYCYEFLTEEESLGEDHWRDHIKQDLEPFSCCSCQDDIKTFVTYESWLEHTREAHVAREWLCTFKEHKKMRFPTEDKFKHHLMKEHRETFKDTQIDVLARLNSRPAVQLFFECPFCGGMPDDLISDESQKSGKPDQLPKHIAGHFKEIALWSLIPTEDQNSSCGTIVTGQVAGSSRDWDFGIDRLKVMTSPPPTDRQMSDDEVSAEADFPSCHSTCGDGVSHPEIAIPGTSAREMEWGPLLPSQEDGQPFDDPTLATFVSHSLSHTEPALRDFHTALKAHTLFTPFNEPYLRVEKFSRWLKEENIDSILKSAYGGITATSDKDNDSLIFSILLLLDAGSCLGEFRKRGLNDDQIPISLTVLAAMEPILPMESLNRFFQLQCRFCPTVFTYLGLANVPGSVIPIYRQHGFADKREIPMLSIIEVLDDFVDTKLREVSGEVRRAAPGSTIVQCYSFALRTFSDTHKSIYEKQKKTCLAMQHSEAVIRYLGSYSTTDLEGRAAHNILLQHAGLDLEEYFRIQTPPALPEELTNFWSTIFLLVDAVTDLHELDRNSDQESYCWHTDIKPENIFYVDGRFKLGGLGLSKKTPEEPLGGGAEKFDPPELFTEAVGAQRLIRQNIDIWSLGCLFSIAATWVVLGHRGVVDFTERRTIGGSSSSGLARVIRVPSTLPKHTRNSDDYFHNGFTVLDEVKSWHEILRSSCRASDNVTPRVLDMANRQMLLADGVARVTLKQLSTQLQHILSPSPAPADEGIPKHFIRGTQGQAEELDSSYAKRSSDHKKFFRPGRVFSTLWTEPYDDSMQIDNDQFLSRATYQVSYKQKVFSRIRRFVVVRQGNRSCTCLPITTYDGRGYKKKGINLDDHGLIYSSRDPPAPIRGITKEPLRIILSKGAEKLGNPSYLNYGRVYTVETNVKIKDIGDLDTESRRLLRAYYREVLLRDSSDEDNYPPPGPSSISQQRDVEVAGAGAAFAPAASQQRYDSRGQYDRSGTGGYNQQQGWSNAGGFPPPTTSLYPATPTYSQPQLTTSGTVPASQFVDTSTSDTNWRSTNYQSDPRYNYQSADPTYDMNRRSTGYRSDSRYNRDDPAASDFSSEPAQAGYYSQDPATPIYSQPQSTVASTVPAYQHADVQTYDMNRRSTGYQSDPRYNQDAPAASGFLSQQGPAGQYSQKSDKRWAQEPSSRTLYQTTPTPVVTSGYYSGRDQVYNDQRPIESSRYAPQDQTYGQSQGIDQGAGWTPTSTGRQVIYEEDLTLPTFEQARSFEGAQASQRSHRESSSRYSTSSRGGYDDPSDRYRGSGSSRRG